MGGKVAKGIPSTHSALSAFSESSDTDANGSRVSDGDKADGFEIKAEIPSHTTDARSAAFPGKAKKTILYPGGFVDARVPVKYVAETNLPTDIGHFRIRAYRIEEFENAIREPHPLGAGAGLGSEPCVIYSTDKPPFGSKGGERGGAKAVPVRIHDQCFTSEVFRSQR